MSSARSRQALKGLLILFSVLYIVVLSNTLIIHNAFNRPFQQLHGPASRLLGGDEQMIQRFSVNHDESVEDRKLIGEVADGDTITSILLGDNPFPSKDKSHRLRFQPGFLNLTQTQALHHCYADPAVYRLHFPSSDRQVTSISDNYKLVYILIPKSGSSTGRWIMNNVLEAKDAPTDPAGSELITTYKDYTVIVFVRDPLSRFYSQYDEIFLRYGPWMKKMKEKRAFQYMKNFTHGYPYLYDNMNEWEDFLDSFCPADLIPYDVKNRGDPKRWCSGQQTAENGTLAARFERFVQDYDGLNPWDTHLHLQVPHISNKHSGRPRRVDELYQTATTMSAWKYIVNWYGQSLPDNGQYTARSIPRRINTSFVAKETKQRICTLSAIDYCCLNMKLPPECSSGEVEIYCSLDQNQQGELRIQPWTHPHEI